MKPEASEAISHLLPPNVKGNLSALCTWPDQIRHWYKYRWTSPLHFIDTPDDACTFDYSSKYMFISYGYFVMCSSRLKILKEQNLCAIKLLLRSSRQSTLDFSKKLIPQLEHMTAKSHGSNVTVGLRY